MTDLDPITQIQLMSGGYFVSRCLQVVADLGIADLISDVPISASELARSTGSHQDALASVLSLLCAHGVFVRVDGRFCHTEASRVLRTDHPMSMRPFARMFGIPVFWHLSCAWMNSLPPGVRWEKKSRPEDFGTILSSTPTLTKNSTTPWQQNRRQ
jgi:hypothetical protein